MNHPTEEKETQEWIVKARCVVIKQFIVRGSREVAEDLNGTGVIDEMEIDQEDVEVLDVEPNI